MQSGPNASEHLWRWSISRSRLFARCPRAFGLSVDQKGIESRPNRGIGLGALVGIAIHESIRHEVDHWAQGTETSPLRALHRASDFIAGAWRDRAVTIIEVMNGFEPDPKILRFIQSAARTRLERFFRILWPQFSDYRHLQHEQLEEFDLDGSKILVKIDLACWNHEDQLCIIDWKTGGWGNELGGRPQMAVYSLWATETLGLGLDRIVPMIVGLESGEVTRFRPTPEDVEYVIDLVRSDRNRFERCREEGQFPPAPEPAKCWACVFLNRCPEGRDAVGL